MQNAIYKSSAIITNSHMSNISILCLKGFSKNNQIF